MRQLPGMRSMKVGDPVLDLECANPGELCDIRGHEHRVQGIGMGSDEQVIRPDGFSGCFQLCANAAIFGVGGNIEGEDLEAVQDGLDLRQQPRRALPGTAIRSEEHTSELQSLMRISYAVFCLKKKNKK